MLLVPILEFWIYGIQVWSPIQVFSLHSTISIGTKTMKEEEEEWKTAAMDASVDSDGDGPDGDIGNGCYVLDIGLNGIEPSKIWVRADYIHIYDELEIWLNDEPMEKAPSAIVVGQPGIGECSSIAGWSH